MKPTHWIFVLALLILIPDAIFAQSRVVLWLARKIQWHNVYEQVVCQDGRHSRKMHNYEKLLDVAGNDDLILLLNHKNPVVCAYAFSALIKRDYDRLGAFVFDHINDMRRFNVRIFGCGYIHGAEFETTVADFFLVHSEDLVSEKEALEIDSLLLCSKNIYASLNIQMRTRVFEKSQQDRIREFVKRNQYYYSPIALARYRDTADLKLLEQKLYQDPNNSIEIIEVFPHDYFKTFILDFAQNHIKLDFMLYNAVASYQDTFALNFLTSEFKNAGDDYAGKERCRYISVAIWKHRNPVYNELFFNLWEFNGLIYDSLFKYLQGVDNEKCSELAEKTLRNADHLKVSGTLVDEMLYYFIVHDVEKAKSIIIEQLNNNEHLNFFPQFAENARFIRDNDLTEALFSRLSTSDNAYIYYPIVSTILLYFDDSLNQRLIETVKSNPNISGWGLEKVKKKLEEYYLTLE